MPKFVLPRVQAMVVCDRVKESDTELGVFRLADVRASNEAATFPAFRPRMWVFAHLSGHVGEATFHVEVKQIETDEAISQSRVKKLTFRGPTFVVPVVFRIKNCVFPSPGIYYVQLSNEGKLIAERHCVCLKSTSHGDLEKQKQARLVRVRLRNDPVCSRHQVKSTHAAGIGMGDPWDSRLNPRRRPPAHCRARTSR